MKTFSTSGTGSGQTLSEIESDKIPIYDSMADAETDLANLSEGQILATKDTGDELAQPVDVVEEGNLHAVSSNAVAESLGYSETEQKTGGVWIDGKPIYRKVVGCGSLLNNNTKAVTHNITNISKIIKVYGFTTDGTNYLPIPYVDANPIKTYANTTTVYVQTYSDRTSYTETEIILEYTKTTD